VSDDPTPSRRTLLHEQRRRPCEEGGVLTNTCLLQLPPFTKWKRAEEFEYDVPLLQHLVKNAPDGLNMMTVQYRMHPALADIISSVFYQDRLSTAPSVAALRDRERPVVFVDNSGSEVKVGTSFKNKQEVKAIVQLVQDEVTKHPHWTVNVIAFHKPQMFALLDALRAAWLLEEGNVEVLTVDTMQGREADIILLSCCRSGSSIGFLGNRKRLNVALSRAREMLYVVGNRATLMQHGTIEWKQVLVHPEMRAL
jgi:superfamily I DNA and/or RNA helicase